MIQSVNFMGREECLTKPAKKVIDKTHEYLGAGAIIENTAKKAVDTSKTVAEKQAAELNAAVRAKYAPFTMTTDTVAKENEQLARDWAISHGAPLK